MKLYSAYLAIAGILAHANAYVYFLNTNWTNIASDTDLPLQWTGDGTPVNISLMHGPADNMQYVRNITVNNPNSTLIWNPRDSHPSGNYALVINQGVFSFSSPRFMLTGAIARVPVSISAVVTMTSAYGPTNQPKIIVVGRETALTAVVTDAPGLAPVLAHRAAKNESERRSVHQKREAPSNGARDPSAQTSVVALSMGTTMVAPSVFLLLTWLAGIVASM